MKRFILYFIMLIGLTFSSVGYANTDVSTKKAVDITVVKADTQLDFHGVYKVVKLNAPEVFNENQTDTKVYLFGEKKAEAFNYLVNYKNGIGIFIGTNKDCYKTEILAVEICKNDKLGLLYDKNILHFKDKTRDQPQPQATPKLTTGVISKITKKRIWHI